MSVLVAQHSKNVMVPVLGFVVWLVLLMGVAVADDAREANQAYENANYQQAEKLYRQAIDKNPQRAQLYFNLANTLAKRGKTQDAIDMYKRFKSMSDNPEDKAKADYNIANLYSEEQNYNKAMNHYRQSLRNDPGDKEAKHNYELAYKKKKKEESSQDKQNQDQGNENKNEQQEQNQDQQGDQDQNKQNEQSKNQQNEQSNNQDSKDQQNSSDQPQNDGEKKEQKENKAQAQPNRVSKAEAEQILKALENREKQLLQQLRNKQSKSQPSNGKDW